MDKLNETINKAKEYKKQADFCSKYSVYFEENASDVAWFCKDVIDLLKKQQEEIKRLKSEKERTIERIESEINRLYKESKCVKDDVGIAQYQWLINGYQSSLDMIKGGDE